MMTVQEHMLLITMFARQERFMKAVVEALISREILTRDDMKAFDALMLSNERETAETLRHAAKNYQGLMSMFGMDIPPEIADI